MSLFSFIGVLWINRNHQRDRGKVEEQIQKQKYSLERELNQIRDTNQQISVVVQSALQAAIAGQNLSNQKRIEIIERLWNAFIKLKTEAPPVVLQSGLLVPSEYEGILADKNLLPELEKLDDQKIREYLNKFSGLEELRPFATKLMWSLFYAYRALYGRILTLFAWSKRDGRMYIRHNDSGIKQILRSVLSEEEYNAVISKEFRGIFDLILIFEEKFLTEADNVLSGRTSTEANLAQAHRILSVVTPLAEALARE